MDKFYAILQITGGALLGVAALATLVNLVLITMRPETISVVNTMIGQGVIIICFLALARVLLRRGLRGLHAEAQSGREAE